MEDRRVVELLGMAVRRNYLLIGSLLICSGLLLRLLSGLGGLEGGAVAGVFSGSADALLTAGVVGIIAKFLADELQREEFILRLRIALSSIPATLGLTSIAVGRLRSEQLLRELARADELALICLFDKRWADDWQPEVDQLLARGGRVRLCVPDPDDALLMAQLGGRHARSGHDFRSDVMGLVSAFARLGDQDNLGKVEIRTVSAPGPAYTFNMVRRGQRTGWGMVRQYKHLMRESASGLEFSFRSGGDLFEHYAGDFEDIWTLARPLYPETQTPWVQRDLAVVGPGDMKAGSPCMDTARSVGRIAAELKMSIITGGRGGVMHAVADGARHGAPPAPGGPRHFSPYPVERSDLFRPVLLDPQKPRPRVIGVLPGIDPADGGAYNSEVWASGFDERRNFDVVANARGVVVVGCNEGTLIEVLHARKMGKPVFGVDEPLLEQLLEKLDVHSRAFEEEQLRQFLRRMMTD